jgi:serine phosphatase RsbU (regulator of sigma subunit)
MFPAMEWVRLSWPTASTRKRYTLSNTLKNPPFCCSAFTHSCGIASPKKTSTLRWGCLADTAQPAAAEEVELASGDRLILYTDGLIEVFKSSGDMLGVEGLEKLVRESATQALPEMKQAILDGVAAWREGTLADDVSLVIIEVR